MLDYAAILQAGQGLVPDLQQQLMQRQEIQLRRDALEMQKQQRAMAISEAQRKQEREAAFRGRLGQVTEQGGNPRAIYQLMIEFPEFADQLKEGAKGLSEEAKNANLVRGGAVYMRAQGGDFEGAAKKLEERITADRAAGNDTAEDEQILAALRSGDPEQQNIALTTLGFGLAVLADPTKFAETLSKLDPEEKKTNDERRYEFWVKTYGKEEADKRQAVADEKFTGVDGVGVFRGSDLVGMPTPPPPKGGDPAVSGGGANLVQDGGAVIKKLFPNARITQVARDPNSALGRKNPDSWHNRSRAAVDVAPIPGMTFEQYVDSIKAAGFSVIEAKDEVKNPSPHATGPHWHVVLGGGGPVRVRSVQEANALPKGTRYITPDGQEMIR